MYKGRVAIKLLNGKLWDGNIFGETELQMYNYEYIIQSTVTMVTSENWLKTYNTELLPTEMVFEDIRPDNKHLNNKYRILGENKQEKGVLDYMQYKKIMVECI